MKKNKTKMKTKTKMKKSKTKTKLKTKTKIKTKMKTSGKTWLTYEERLKRIKMITRKNNDRINDDIDHNNVIII